MILLLAAGAAVAARPQAWLPAKGEGYFSLNYQSMFSGDHLRGDRLVSNRGPMRSSVVSAGILYAITDRLTVGADMPYVATKFTLAPGLLPSAHDLEAKNDDGRYHGTLQDLRGTVRYNAVRGPLMVTPFFQVVIPTHHYQTFGHAGTGRYLREYQVGFSMGRLLNPILPRAYFDLRYGYSFVQSLGNLNLDRNNVDLEIGYFLKRYLSVRAVGGLQKTLGGIEIPIPETSPFFSIHDRVERAHFSRMGGGASLVVRKNMDVHGLFLATLSGRNTHSFTVLSLGVSWNFRTRAGPEDALQSKLAAQPGLPAQ